MSLFIHRNIQRANKPNNSHIVSSELRKVNKHRKIIENMDAITATNTISLKRDIELTNKVLSLHAKHFAPPANETNEKQQNCVLLSKRYSLSIFNKKIFFL